MPRELPRTLGVRELTVFYITSIIGAGILITPGIAAQIAGPSSVLVWIGLVGLCYPFAAFFAQMSRENPDCGGIASFVRRGLGDRAGDVAALLLVAVYVVGNPVMGITTATYLALLTGIDDHAAILAIGLGFMLVSISFNLLGLKLGSRVQTAALYVLVAALIVVLAVSAPHADPSVLRDPLPRDAFALGSAAVIAFFSFLGWENASTIAEDVRDPERTFLLAIRRAVPIVGLLYIAIAVAVVTVLPQSDSALDRAFLVGLLERSVGPDAGRVGAILAVVLLVVATNAWVLGASRVVLSASRSCLLPAWLTQLHDRTRVPRRCLLALAVAYSAVTGILVVTGAGLDNLIAGTNAVFMLLYLAAAVAGIRCFATARGRRLAVTVGAATLVLLPFTAAGLPWAGAAVAAALWATWHRRRLAARNSDPNAITSNEEQPMHKKTLGADATPEFGVLCDRVLPWEGQEEPPFGSMWCQVAPGGSSEPDIHNQGELIIAMDGSGEVEIGDNRVAMSAGDVVFCPRNITHTVHNGDQGAALSFLSVYWPRVEQPV